MISVSFSGNSVQEVAKEAQQFADLVLSPLPGSGSLVEGEASGAGANSYEGYRPAGVGSVGKWYPIDDGREWSVEALTHWIQSLTEEGRKAVEAVARRKMITMKEADNLGWSHAKWAGVWTGPRKKAKKVMTSRRLKSWPYGHSYEKPRPVWMHEVIAERVLSIIQGQQEVDTETA